MQKADCENSENLTAFVQQKRDHQLLCWESKFLSGLLGILFLGEIDLIACSQPFHLFATCFLCSSKKEILTCLNQDHTVVF
jgi:hypothetical protein